MSDVAYADSLDREPVVVTAALTGGVHGKEANASIPENPEEIAGRPQRRRPRERLRR